MARNSRPPGKPDARSRRRGAGSSGEPRQPAPLVAATSEPAQPAARKPQLSFTKRAIVLGVLLVMMGGSYVGSLRTLLTQQHQRAVAEQAIAERSAEVARLESELQRWRDPAYVKAQARARLGWVLPGEVGYRVVGADGVVLSGAVEIEGVGGRQAHETIRPAWWEELAGSVAAADQPAPVSAPEP